MSSEEITNVIETHILSLSSMMEKASLQPAEYAQCLDSLCRAAELIYPDARRQSRLSSIYKQVTTRETV